MSSALSAFAHNEITGMQNGDNHRGVNTNNLDLSYNHLENSLE